MYAFVELDSSPKSNKVNNNKNMLLVDGYDTYLQKILQFGRELFQMTNGENSPNSKMLKVRLKF